VVFFHDQPLSPGQFMAFARAYGTPIEYPQVKGIAGFPEVIEVKKLEHERQNFGGLWHSDTATSSLHDGLDAARARGPAYGGDNRVRQPVHGYETLSEGMPQTAGRLVAINASTKADARARARTMKEQGLRPNSSGEHPVVRTIRRPGAGALRKRRPHRAFRTCRGGERDRCWSSSIGTRCVRARTCGSAGAWLARVLDTLHAATPAPGLRMGANDRVLGQELLGSLALLLHAVLARARGIGLG